MAAIDLPSLPVPHDRFIQHVAAHPSTPMPEILRPFHHYENELRKVFAQQPDHAAAQQSSITPIFGGSENDVKIRSRDLTVESDKAKEAYIMPLKLSERKPNGSHAIARSLQEFQTHFSLFTESSLADLNWDNVVVAGSAVVTSLLSVPEEYSRSKRDLRRYYHEIVAPASDVDLFLYGLTEEQAIEKIKQIEKNVRDALLVETTTVRTKNTITIVSQYPVRHVQIVLRIYKSITEILTGFDVDCSCAAYDGKQVWASPRALAAFMTQTNTIDLTRRSPSYENRLSKYRHRGFEVHFPELDRSRIDPTIYERSFVRTEGLARLLILEKLPKSSEREAYIDQRRLERGRPAADRSRMKQKLTRGDIKNKFEDEVAEWVDTDEVSSYHTFTIPYGPKFHARKIEKLLYTKDLLLNAEWNKPKDREVNLHRHLAFFGSVGDVIGDCCGFCPSPVTIEEEEVAEKESKIYVSGEVVFMKDNCGRQAIGSFNPLSPDEYTDMAYVGNTQLLCQAIVELDLHYVEQWLGQEGNDANTRDHTGRTPLHLAASCSSLDVVQKLIEHGARLVARLVDGKTALHLACFRGDAQIVAALLKKSEANEEEQARKTDTKRKSRLAAKATPEIQDADFEMIDRPNTESEVGATIEGSVVNVQIPDTSTEGQLDAEEDETTDVLDVNILTWDTPASPLHLAILCGHREVVRCLVQDFGANVLLPMVLPSTYAGGPSAGALLTLTLAQRLPLEEAKEMIRLLSELGASCAQADTKQKTALEYCIANEPALLNAYLTADPTGAARALKHVSIQGPSYRVEVSGPFLMAISNRDSETALRLLAAGARPDIPFEAYLKGVDKTANRSRFDDDVEQPVICAVFSELPSVAAALVENYGVDVNTLSCDGWKGLHNSFGHRANGGSLLECVRARIKHLSEWKHEQNVASYTPTPLSSDDSYLNRYTQGTYQHWSATRQLQNAKLRYDQDLERHAQIVKHIADNEVGLDKKEAAIRDTLDEFRKLEDLLLARSAKTFKELHPETEENNSSRGERYRGYSPPRPQPFKLEFAFNVPIPNEEVRDKYIRLFESVWQGDVKSVKELTLLPWTNDEGEKSPPLQIAVRDRQNSSPLSIAVLSGKLDLARMIMQIAKAQYTAPEAPKARQYHIDNDSDEGCTYDSDDDDSDDIPIASVIIDEQATIEDIGTVSLNVNSNVKPEKMLYWMIPKDGKTGIDSRQRAPTNLIEAALQRDDQQLLIFLLDLADQYADKVDGSHKQNEDEHGRDRLETNIHLSSALRVGKPHLVAELIKRTAAGISVAELAMAHGAHETAEKPKYYQGLNVNGKKRKDWAAAGRNISGLQDKSPSVSPLLMTAYNGKLEHMEWFLSDAPLRCYKEYAQSHQDDTRVRKLSQVPGGFESIVKEFMSARSDMAIHCCLAGEQTTDSLEMLKYLTVAMPETVEARSADGLTPLLLACRVRNIEAAKILMEAGADQTARDNDGKNLLHQMLSGAHFDDHPLRQLIEIIDQRLITSMCLQRCSTEPGGLTPFALWLVQGNNSKETKLSIARAVLEISNGEELAMLSGEGHTPLHVLARHDEHFNRSNHCDLASLILEHRPEMVKWENATGKSPFDMVEDTILACKCSKTGSLTRLRSRRRYISTYDIGSSSITALAPRDFQEQAEDDNSENHPDVEARQRSEKLRTLLLGVQAKLSAEGKGARRLVTLNEASEVARRLAAVQRKRIEREDEEEGLGYRMQVQKSKKDPVEEWISRANGW